MKGLVILFHVMTQSFGSVMVKNPSFGCEIARYSMVTLITCFYNVTSRGLLQLLSQESKVEGKGFIWANLFFVCFFFWNTYCSHLNNVIFWIQRKESSGGSWLLTMQVHLMSEGTEPPRGNLTSNWFKDRAKLWTKFRYLLALTDLSWQLSGLKCRYGRATDKNKYRAVSDSEGRGKTGHTGRVTAPVCVTLVVGRARWALQAARSPHRVGAGSTSLTLWPHASCETADTETKPPSKTEEPRSQGCHRPSARPLIDWLVNWRRGVSSSIHLYFTFFYFLNPQKALQII